MTAIAMPALAPPERPEWDEKEDVAAVEVEEAAAKAGSVEVEVAEAEVWKVLDDVVFETVSVLDPLFDVLALVAAVIVVEAAYVITAPTVLTSVKSPPSMEFAESSGSESLM